MTRAWKINIRRRCPGLLFVFRRHKRTRSRERKDFFHARAVMFRREKMATMKPKIDMIIIDYCIIQVVSHQRIITGVSFTLHSIFFTQTNSMSVFRAAWKVKYLWYSQWSGNTVLCFMGSFLSGQSEKQFF